MAVRYTGVDTTNPNPVDVSAGGTTPTNPGTTLTAPAVTTTFANDQIVRFYGTGSTSITAGSATYIQNAASTATGVEDANQASAGSTGTATATSGASDDWVGDTIAVRDSRSSITIARPANRADGDFLLVAVTAQDLGGRQYLRAERRHLDARPAGPPAGVG